MATAENDRALRIAEVILRTGMSRAWIYAEMAAGRFPRAFKIGARASAWLESDVSKYIADRAGSRSADGAKTGD